MGKWNMTTKPHFAKLRSRAFTLVELLVVVAIISMLMSITLPALERARKAGKRIGCFSNLRQLTLAWIMYAIDNDDRLCSAGTYWNHPPGSWPVLGTDHWVGDGPHLPGPESNPLGNTENAIKDGVLWPYTQKTLGVYWCPSDSIKRLRSYSMSNSMGGRVRDNVRPFRKLGEIWTPAERMVFIDAGGDSWLEDGFWPIQRTGRKWRWRIRKFNMITARHTCGCNLAFSDGHCEFWRWNDLTIRFFKGRINELDASKDNPDLHRMAHLLKGRTH